jgi:hypothetical protein
MAASKGNLVGTLKVSAQ